MKLDDLKRKLSPQLFQLTGVNGVGLSATQIVVYVESDSVDTYSQIDEILKKELTSDQINQLIVFKVAGKFIPHLLL